MRRMPTRAPAASSAARPCSPMASSSPTPSLPPISGTLVRHLNAHVIFACGHASVSDQVRTDLGDRFLERIAGVDRFETAAKLGDFVAQGLKATGQPALTRAFLTSGETFAD